MKKFIINLFVFFVVAGIIAASFEFAFRAKPNVHKMKYAGLEKKASEVEVLIVGNSYIDKGVDPELFDLRAYDMAMGFQNIYFDRFVIDRFIDRMPKLKCVLIGTSFFHFFDTLPEMDKISGELLFGVKKYHMYWGLDSLASERISNWIPKYNLEIVGNPVNAYVDLLGYYLDPGKRRAINSAMDRVFEYGYQPVYETPDNRGLIRDAESSLRAHNPPAGMTAEDFLKDGYPANYYIYEDIIKQCASHSVNVVMVICPTSKAYYTGASQSQLQATCTMISQLEAEHANCFFLNYFSDERFSVGDFSDSHHLNCHGADKFTRILTHDLDSSGVFYFDGGVN